MTSLLRSALAILAMLICAAPSFAQDNAASFGSIAGRVLSNDGGVPFAHVAVKGTARSTVADAQGRFRLANLPPGTYTLLFSSMGFATSTASARVQADAPATVDVTLTETAVPINPIVITATMKQTFVSESPVKVDVVTARYLENNVSGNLMESILHVNGLHQQIDCGVCYTNNIRINGMEGPYTAVLIDGMPIMNALASVYGLNGINPALIERLEIVKGPSSTLYGSEAMGGVVNVITKDPRFTPRATVDLRRTNEGRTELDFAASPANGSVSSLVSGSFEHMDNFVDDNGDDFTDEVMAKKATLFGKFNVRNGERSLLTLSGKYYYENRFGGQRGWTSSLRGSDIVYGESTYTNRAELIGSYALPFRPAELRLDFSYAWHDQDSYYGTTKYAGAQRTAFANLIWDSELGLKHDLLAGVTFRHQTYDDETPATAAGAVRRMIPGVFIQDEYSATRQVKVLGGVRLDHHQDHGFILSPRASLKWEAGEFTALRLNGGTGFRVVNLFTEEYANLHGVRELKVMDALEPERSYSATLNLNQIIEFGTNNMMIDVDAFYTYFTNRIIADYDSDPRYVTYDNMHGHGVTRGLSLSLNQNFSRFPLLYTVGVTLQDVYVIDNAVKRAELYAPDYKAVWSVGYTFNNPKVTVDYTGTVVGRMRLPEYPEPFRRATRSPTYAVHNVQAALALRTGVEVYAALKNALNYTQPSPLIDASNPFGDNFDTAYIYGPIAGRSLVAGVRWGLGR